MYILRMTTKVQLTQRNLKCSKYVTDAESLHLTKQREIANYDYRRQEAGGRHAKDKGRFWHLKDLLLNESAVSEAWVGKAPQKTQIGHLLLPDANSLAKARNQSTGRHARQVRKSQTEQMRAWEYSKTNDLRNRGWRLDVLQN